jgi:adenylate cyclase
MSHDRTQRKLVVIVHADVAGYASLMARDEDLAHQRVNAAFDLLEEAVGRYGGLVAEKRGDALLAEFAGPSDALGAALVFQREIEERHRAIEDEIRPRMRIGINLGEVIADRGTVWGPGVNLAQRVEQLAPPGGVAISDTVYNAISKSLPVDYVDLGEQQVKESAVRAYEARLRSGEPMAPAAQGKPMAGETPAREVTPSIAILPFTTMSDDPEQEFFADGLVEDIITALAKLSGLLVIARNSTFVYEGRSVDVRQVARELNVRYVLEGSVRKAGDRVRVTAQLIDAESGAHVWAERYDRTLADILAVQDEITLIVATEMQVKLTEGEQARLRYSVTSNVEAWTQWSEGLSYYRRGPVTKDNLRRVRTCWEKAFALDPRSATLNAMLGFIHYLDARFGWWDDREIALEKGREYERRALELDPADADAYTTSSLFLLLQRRHDEAVEHARTAVELAPGSADAAAFACFVLASSGHPEEAVTQMERAMTLSPIYPAYYLGHLGQAYSLSGRLDDAIATFRAYGERSPGFGLSDLVVAYQLQGRHQHARQAARDLMAARPDFTIGSWVKTQFRRDADQLESEIAALRSAGLPMN